MPAKGPPQNALMLPLVLNKLLLMHRPHFTTESVKGHYQAIRNQSFIRTISLFPPQYCKVPWHLRTFIPAPLSSITFTPHANPTYNRQKNNFTGFSINKFAIKKSSNIETSS